MAIQVFKKWLKENKMEFQVIETKESTKTAVEAAYVHKVPVSNIVKSLLVKVDSKYELFLVPGDKRLDLDALKLRYKTETIRMANADEVKLVTGYSIGGVPPFGHIQPIKTEIVDGFDKNDVLVAAGGASNAVFEISYSELTLVIEDVNKIVK
jgi:prolyl-tRNA editing enzyme YbaK/EbsC (Cys-tRNA(Pro) deacylase)